MARVGALFEPMRAHMRVAIHAQLGEREDGHAPAVLLRAARGHWPADGADSGTGVGLLITNAVITLGAIWLHAATRVSHPGLEHATHLRVTQRQQRPQALLNPAQQALLHGCSVDGGEGSPEWLTSVLAEMTTAHGRRHLALLILLSTALLLLTPLRDDAHRGGQSANDGLRHPAGGTTTAAVVTAVAAVGVVVVTQHGKVSETPLEPHEEGRRRVERRHRVAFEHG